MSSGIPAEDWIGHHARFAPSSPAAHDLALDIAASLTSRRRRSAAALWAEAVIREGDLAVVWVEEEPMVFGRRKVKLGLEQEGRVQIREGLRAGDLVLVSGAIFVDNESRQ